jgi:monoamine oxidase
MACDLRAQRAGPVGGRLLFGGEHAQSPRLGYADGALSSGTREAKRLLGPPAACLTVDHGLKGA